MPGCSSYFAAGVRTCTAEVEVGDRRAVVRPTGEWTLREVLASDDIEVADVSVGKPDPSFQVDGCEQRPVHDNIAKIRRVGRRGCQ